MHVQAGTVASHPKQTERQLEEVANRNPYQLALVRMHQARYQAQPHTQTGLLQVSGMSLHAMLACLPELASGSTWHKPRGSKVRWQTPLEVFCITCWQTCPLLALADCNIIAVAEVTEAC